MNLIPIEQLMNASDIVLTAMVEVKPYGVYLMANGDRILYDRGYCPIMHWSQETQKITCIKDSYWVNYKEQRWFYDDGLSVQKTAALRRMITALWVGGYPVLPEDMPDIHKKLKEFEI